ncbi:hypothetical protein Golomagni_00302 [Golovinomyces magnicellulatus]|nr:hypothetical protein Golomagni_00302 [Golovinomyces magnicellulatus]
MPNLSRNLARKIAKPNTSAKQALLPSKQCCYCERKFSKAEHLKRHERSRQINPLQAGHIPSASPSEDISLIKFVRYGDVLIRHLKNHPRLSEQENENERSESVSMRNKIQEGDPNSTSIAASLHPLHARCHFSQTKSRATQYLGVPNNEHASLVQPFTSGLDHLATLASHQDYGRDILDPVIRVEAQETFHNLSPYTLSDTNSTQDWDHIQPTSQQNSQIDPNLDPRLTQPEKCFRPLDKNAETIS